MSVTNETRIVQTDAATIVDAVQDACEGTAYTLVEYDAEVYTPLYIDDAMRAFYENDDQMYDHFDEIHSYIHVDFTEIDLFTDTLFPIADRVEYIVTSLDFLKLVRVYHGRAGFFVSVEPDEPIVDLVEAIDDVVEW